jgi:hypothetical protein
LKSDAAFFGESQVLPLKVFRLRVCRVTIELKKKKGRSVMGAAFLWVSGLAETLR